LGGRRGELDQRQGEVVALAVGAAARARHQHLRGLARRQRRQDLCELGIGEVVPQPVRAEQERVAIGERARRAERRLGKLGLTERLEEEVPVRVGVTILLPDLAFPGQLLDQRVIGGAVHQLGAPEMIEPAVADVTPVDPVGLQQERHERAVRLLLGEKSIQLDHGVGFDHDLAQQLFGRLFLGREVLKEIRRGGDDLRGRCGAAGVSAGAVGEHDERRPFDSFARDDRDPVLLLLAIADVRAGGGVDCQGHGSSARAALPASIN